MRAGPEPQPEPREETAQALKLWVVLARAHATVLQTVQEDIARHGLTPGEFGVLEALYHKGPLLLGEIQRLVLVSSGGVTYLVDRLAAKGLVVREDCEGDRRARYARLTPAGAAQMAAIFPDHAAAVTRAVAGLTPSEQARATDLLRRLGLAAASATAAQPSPGGASGGR